MEYHQPYEVMAFHSCDKELGLRLLSGSDELRPSNNPWDWLGPGIYFWEQNPSRALTYAEEAAQQQQKFSGRIKTPFVVGAIIELGYCMNLMDPYSIRIIRGAHKILLEQMREIGKNMPVNKGANRQLDCAVIKCAHESFKQNGLSSFDSVRCPFIEGLPIYNGANFTDRLHVEICVRNPSMIKGYFLPRPVERFNPYLN